MKNSFSFYVVVLTCFLLFSACKTENNNTTELKFTTWQEGSIPVVNYDKFKAILENSKDDKLYVFNFWATWCKPCVEELPYFEAINKKYDDVEVTLVSLDFSEKLNELVIPFANKYELVSNILLLEDTRSFYWIPDVDENWSGAIPATLMFSKNGKTFYEKAFTFEELETEIKNNMP